MNESSHYPVRHSRRFSNKLIEDAQRVFGERYGREVTAEEARQMLENLTGFFTTLHRMDQTQKARNAEAMAEMRSQITGHSQTPSEMLLRDGRGER